MKDLRTKHGGTLSLSRSRRRCQEAGCSSPFGSHRVLMRTEKVFFSSSPDRYVSMSRCNYYHGNLPKCRFNITLSLLLSLKHHRERNATNNEEKTRFHPSNRSVSHCSVHNDNSGTKTLKNQKKKKHTKSNPNFEKR